ncbi:MAG: response regulator [Bacteroidota bacterium]
MQSKRVLIVDDQPAILTILASGVRKLGDDFEVETASSGREAIKKIHSLKHIHQDFYTLVITDYKMPDMNGIEVAQAVKKCSPETHLILMSAYEMEEIKARAESLEVVGMLNKPISIARIRTVIEQVLELAQKNSRKPILSQVQNNTYQPSPLFEPLQSLRANTNARCVLLLSSSGHMIEMAGHVETDISNVSALVAANFMAGFELAKLIGNDTVFKSSYYEGANFDIYSHDIDGKFILATIFGPESKAGMIRFYVSKAVQTLPALLTDDLFEVDFSESDISKSLENEIENLFL